MIVGRAILPAVGFQPAGPAGKRVPGDWPSLAAKTEALQIQAARVQRVSEASGCFCDFAAGGPAAAKSPKFSKGASMAVAKIWSRTSASRSSREGRIDLRRHFGNGRYSLVRWNPELRMDASRSRL